MRTISALLGLFGLIASAWTQGTAFTYQGYLRQSGNPVSANHDFQFSLWTAVSGGSQVGATQTVTNVSVQNGLFTVTLDFGNVWDGADRFLQIAVRPAGSGSYTTLSPRVKINPTPYSIRAGVASPIGAAGGDLSGSYPNPTVARLQGRSVSNAAPGAGQVLKWNGSAWAPAADDVGGLTLPFSGSANVPGAVFQVTNTAPSGFAFGVYGVSASTSGRGVYGVASAVSGSTYGGWFESASTSGTGVLGLATAASGFTYGVYGSSDSDSGKGVFGWATATSGATHGGWFESHSPDGTGVFGWVSATSGFTYGVYGRSASTSGRGVYGEATAANGGAFGVHGSSASTSGRGVYGEATATSGETFGVYGRSASTSGYGVYGLATATSGETFGVYGHSVSTSGRGVLGLATATSGVNFGGWFRSTSTSGRGVFSWASASSGATYGGLFQNDSTSGTGVSGVATAATGVNWGVFGESMSASGTGVAGLATATSGTNYGGWFESRSNTGFGVHAWAKATSGVNYGIKAITSSAAGWAGYFEGRVFVNGAFSASGTKAFQIDHPLTPETHYLNHFCAEGPEPYNLYRGNVTTDAQGYAVVQLPDYFEAVNRDPTYHLTVIDSSDDFILAKVVREIQNNRFVIRTSKPFVKVSWEVKAIRNDLWVQRYGYQTEQEKEDNLKGKYLNPELYGQPKERSIHQHPEPAPAPTEQAKP